MARPENILLFVKGGQLRARRIETPGYPIHNCASMNGCSLLQSSYESLQHYNICFQQQLPYSPGYKRLPVKASSLAEEILAFTGGAGAWVYCMYMYRILSG